MKKIMYGMLLLTGMSGAAVQRSQNGQGDAMIIPFYTVQQGHHSVVVIQNYSGDSKAIKVNVREQLIGAAVMSANVYLAPGDEWRGQFSQLSNGAHGADTTEYRKLDSSCTPLFGQSWEFVPHIVQLDYPDVEGYSMIHSQLGYVEIIEMGTVQSPYADYLAMNNGDPSDCDAVENLWDVGGQWDINSHQNMSETSGGLVSFLELNAEPTSRIYASAIEGFFDDGEFAHSGPGWLFPVFTTGVSTASDVGFNTFWPDGLDASVSMYLVHAIEGQFDLSGGRNEEWLITVLNRNEYAYNASKGSQAVKPFLNLYQENGGCENLEVLVYDSQDQLQTGVDNTGFSLCQTANVVVIEGSVPATSNLANQWDRVIDVGSLTSGRIVIKTMNHWTMDGVNVDDASQEIVHYGLPLIAHAYQQDGGTGAFSPLTLHRRTVLDVIFVDGVD